MNFYWKNEDIDKIKEFYYCQSAATSGTTRSIIYARLIPKFNYLINSAINSTISNFSVSDKLEIQQELLTHIWEILTNYLRPEKIVGIQNYLWLSCRNYLHEIYRRRTSGKAIKILYTDDANVIDKFTDTDDSDFSMLTETEIHQKILEGLDKITPKQRKSSGNQNVLKIVKCLKEYLIEHQFTEIENFKEYCLKELNITNHQFIIATNKLHISALLFKPKKNIYRKNINEKVYQYGSRRVYNQNFYKNHKKK